MKTMTVLIISLFRQFYQVTMSSLTASPNFNISAVKNQYQIRLFLKLHSEIGWRLIFVSICKVLFVQRLPVPSVQTNIVLSGPAPVFDIAFTPQPYCVAGFRAYMVTSVMAAGTFSSTGLVSSVVCRLGPSATAFTGRQDIWNDVKDILRMQLRGISTCFLAALYDCMSTCFIRCSVFVTIHL